MADLGPLQQRALTEGESRQHVTVLFTDVSDSTRLSGAMEAETYASMLDDVRRAFCVVVEARGGVVNQYQGDGLQAIFGYPGPTEHDSRNGAEAALEVHDFVRKLRGRYASEGAVGLSVHSGLHAGQALLRPGDSVAGRIEMFGPAPGIAKHLSDIASADEILVTDETLGPDTKLFSTSSPRSVLIQGRSVPLVVRAVLSRQDRGALVKAHTRRGVVPFVGRKIEMRRLESLLAEVLLGQLRFARLSAPAGMGKSRLAEEFLSRASLRGCMVLTGYCDSEIRSAPLQPLLRMLHAQLQSSRDAATVRALASIEADLAALDSALADSQAELLTTLVESRPEVSSRSPAANTTRALHDVISALARRGPLALFIDDWHWADDATRQLFDDLREQSALPLMLIVAERAGHEELGNAAVHRIELKPFNEQEALATVKTLLPVADPFVGSQIVHQAGGNPLFIEELCHFAARDGRPPQANLAHGGPAWLETLIASRVASLPPAQRRVLEAAAVVGTQVPVWLLESLAGCAADDPCVTALAAEDLLFPSSDEGLLRFKHGITRDVVYGSIGLQARRAAHRRAAALLAKPGDLAAESQACEALAYHCSGAGEHARAARCAVMAGDKAMLPSSIDRAKAQYRTALELMDRLPPGPELYREWRSVVRKLGMASVFDPAREELQWFERAASQAREYNDGSGLAFACYWRAYVAYALGESRNVVEHCAAALAAAEAAGDARLANQVRLLQGQALAARGEGAAAEALLDETLMRKAQDQRPGERPTPGVAFTLACRASVLGDRGRFAEAYADFSRALEALPSPGHEVEGSVLCLRSNVYLWHARWGEAAADAASAQRVAERVRSLYLLSMSRALGAWAAWKIGQHDGASEPPLAALQSLSEATAWMVARDKRLFISLNHGRLAEAFSVTGEHALAREHAALALRRWRDRDPLGAPTALRALARVAMAERRPSLASRRLVLAERVALGRDSAHEHAANALCREELGLR